MARWLGRPVPDPGRGAAVELGGGDAGSMIDLVGVDEGLAGDGLTAEQPPPGLLEIEPAGTNRNEDLVDARMVC